MEKSSDALMKSQPKINLSDIYTEKEIESMKKLIPKLSSLIISTTTDDRKLSSYKSIKTNYIIEKDKFVKLITERFSKILKEEDSKIFNKSISYLLTENHDIKKEKPKKTHRESAVIRKKNLFVKIKEKSNSNGNVIFFPQKKTNSYYLHKNIFPRNKTNINSNFNKTNNFQNKYNKKTIDIKYENNFRDIKLKNIKSNSIINNFITFSNTTEPEQLLITKNHIPNFANLYNNNTINGNISSNSRKSNPINISNNYRNKFNLKYSKGKLSPLNSIGNFIISEKLESTKNNDIKKKNKYSNINSNRYSINFIKKIEKIKTDANFVKQNFSGRKSRQEKKLELSDSSLTNPSITNISITVNKKTIMPKKPKAIKKEKINKPIIDKTLDAKIETKDFDIFNYESKVGPENLLYLISSYIYTKFNFSKLIKQTKFGNWSKKIAAGYLRSNPYHNDRHAADVTQTCFLYLLQDGVKNIAKVDDVDVCVLILSCMCHDYKHVGFNNNFLRLTKDKLAIRYNDISILENMHISEAFKLINRNPECDIFSGVDNVTYEKMRKKMIACVLTTDMINHPKHIEFMKNFVEQKNNINIQDNQPLMNLLIHSSDISNPTKPFEIYLKWAKLILEEFCIQGDREKELGLVCTTDRTKVNLNKNQIGFIDYVVEGFVSPFVQIFPNLKFLHDNLVKNRENFLNYKDDDNMKNNKNKKLIKK